VSPHLGLLGHWDFINEGNFAVGTGTVVQTPDVGASISGGVNVAFVSEVSLALASQYYFTDTAFDTWSVSLGGSVPISTLGMFGDRAGGFARLEFKGAPDTGTAALRVSLPLN